MELKDYWQALRHRWGIFVACTLLGVLAASMLTLMTPKVYEARTELFVAPEAGSNTSELMQGSAFVVDRVKSYVQVMDRQLVLGPVIEDLGLDMSVSQLSDQVSATAIEETVVVVITATSDSAEEAALIANGVAAEFVDLAPSLEPSRAGQTGVVRVTVTDPARVPSAPISPRPIFNLALGLLLGLALGMAAAVAREALDRRVKDEADVKALTLVPVLGHIPVDDDAADHPVIVGAAQHGLRAEAVRQLRTNMQFLDVPSQERSYVVTSSVPGEGKTLTSVNLAITLAEMGQRVCLLEADLRRPTGAEYLGLEGAVGLSHVLIGSANWRDMMQPWGSGLDVMLAGAVPPNPSDLLASDAMDELMDALEAAYDTVIVDAPPLLPVADAAILARRCTGAIVVVGFGRRAVNRRGLTESLEILDTIGARVLGVVLNKVPVRGPHGRPLSPYAPTLAATSRQQRRGKHKARGATPAGSESLPAAKSIPQSS